MVAEAVGAAIFTLAVAAAVFHAERTEGNRGALVGGGLALGIIAASSASVGIINPAVAMATNAWAWGTYVLGPVLGAVIGVNLYGLVFAAGGRKAVAAGAGAGAAASTSVAAKPAAKKAPAKRKAPAKKRATARKR
jgi:hypothetical protein